MNKIKVIAGIVKDQDRILITRRGPKEVFAGWWEFPGGKIEFGESHEECIRRELEEELDILVSVGDFCEESFHDYGNMKVKLKAYYCKILSGDLEMRVHDKYKWIKAEELLNYELLPADIPIAEKIMQNNE